MLNIGFGHVQPDCWEPRPNLLNGIKKSSGAAANIEKSQVALVPTSKDFTELGQCLPADRIGCPVKKNFDLGVIPLSRIVRHPAARLEMKILQIIARPLSARFLGQNFGSCAAVAASMNFRQVLEEKP